MRVKCKRIDYRDFSFKKKKRKTFKLGKKKQGKRLYGKALRGRRKHQSLAYNPEQQMAELWQT